MADREPPLRSAVLVVDDEPTVLRALSSTLSSAGFRVLVADSGAAGLELYRDHRTEIRLSIIDVVMPAMSGIELAEAILAIEPAAKILLMSGYADAASGIEERKQFPFLRKPFLPSDLLNQVRGLLGRAAEAK
jgi:DNA-binding NtrC family response regulator